LVRRQVSNTFSRSLDLIEERADGWNREGGQTKTFAREREEVTT
jgi:hypothetical protein